MRLHPLRYRLGLLIHIISRINLAAILRRLRKVLVCVHVTSSILVEVIHPLILRKVLKLATNGFTFAYVQLAIDIVAIDNENDQENQQHDVHKCGHAR